MEEWKNSAALPDGHQRLLDRLHSEHKFVICFFGSINVSYAVDYLIKAQQKLKDERAAIIIIGEGMQKEELMKLAGENVYFLPRISKTAIPSLMENIDCCYVGALHNNMFRFGICMNKLFDSMMSGKPILYAVDAPNNFITDYNCGVSVEAENVDALVNGIKQLMNMDEYEIKGLGENGRNAVVV